MPQSLDFAENDPHWDGRTYYGRSQLKPAPFNKHLVGGYVFLAGLSGAAQLLSSLMDLVGGRHVEPLVQRGRLLSLLAPTIGSVFLIADLHTPKRFYNMLRVFKRTSPMSIGTWILMAFTGFSGLTVASQWLAGWLPRLAWMRLAAKITQVPAAIAGAGLGVYTASLLSATSTPLWAAAPKALSVRFAASSVASASAALSLCAERRDLRRDMDALCMGALAIELGATFAAEQRYRQTGVDAALHSIAGQVDRVGSTGVGAVIPIGLLAASMMMGNRSRTVSGVASCAVLVGSLLMRIAVIGCGDVSASRPDISLRYTQPER